MSTQTMNPVTYASDLIRTVNERIYGRMCYEQNNCNYLAWAIAQAGNGDHLEIGTLHGGSAILAALVKQQCGFSGDVWCIDPLNGYYVGTPYGCPVDWVSKIAVSPETLAGNVAAFGLEDRIHWIQAKSLPFPEQLKDHAFASAFIDGDHWGDAPLLDWASCKDRVSRMVVFDNDDRATHPAVMKAVEVARSDPFWTCVLRAGITAVFERIPA